MANQKHISVPKAFTLIELLVVISIISMLMSILMPSLIKARQQAHRIACMANLNQLTLAWQLYATENDEKLCSANTEWNIAGDAHWVADGPVSPTNTTGGTIEALSNGSLWTYTGKMPDLYKCHSDKTDLLRSYAISRTMNGKTCNCEHDNIKPFRALAQVEHPAERMVFTDAETRKDWIAGSFCQMKDVTAANPTWFVSDYRNISARHNNGCNLSFADGHCKYWKYKDPRTVELALWKLSSEEASTDNQDLLRMVQLMRGEGQ